MESYGWRIPFLLAGPLGLVGLYIRLRLADTPQFAELSKAEQVAKSPLGEAVRTAWRPILQVIGLMIIFNIGYYVVFTFLPTTSSRRCTSPRPTRSFPARLPVWWR